MSIYDIDLHDPNTESPIPFEIVETDIDLYYHIAFSLYIEIESNNRINRDTIVILPVGPIFQYQRFVFLCRNRPIDLSRLYCFFMDEYLDTDRNLIDRDHCLSFRGFIDRNFIDPMPSEMNLKKENIQFPDPGNPEVYDKRLTSKGKADICFAGVGINGHLAFNEPFEKGTEISESDFCLLPTRTIRLTRETITINSNTALKGAYEEIPEYAVTIGFKQIMESGKIWIYLNRPWQSSVVRKILFSEKTPAFPASLIRNHPDVRLILTEEVAKKPDFQLR